MRGDRVWGTVLGGSWRGAAAMLAWIVAAALPAPAQELVLELGGSGSDPGEFFEITGIDVDGAGRIYVVDAGNRRVQVFSPDGTLFHVFGTPGEGPGQFDSGICGIAVDDRRDRIYVSEGFPGFANHRIQAFDLEGTFQFQFGIQGSGEGELDSPCQMALDRDGLLYVVDAGNARVQVFDPTGGSGRFRHALGRRGTGDGELNRPSGVAIDPSGRVFVSDSFAANIQVFDFGGRFLSRFGTGGEGLGELNRPCHIAQGGLLFVANALNERVQVLDMEGNLHLEFDVEGSEPSIFCSNTPMAIATDRLGRIYVEEASFVRVYSIDRDGDGLLDLWETRGIDTDGDGVVDLPLHLPPYGADPDHKDLFYEVDWHPETPPTQSVIADAKETFCAAPVDAGGLPNPDGEPGIRLHVDTGSVVDASNGSEAPRVPCSCRDGLDNDGDALVDADDPACYDLDPLGGEGGAGLVTCDDDLDNDGDGLIDTDDTECPRVFDPFATEWAAVSWPCNDGVDNDGDGLADAADPECLVGDDLGGGSVLADPSGAPFSGAICDISAAFFDAKAAHFAPERALVFRYALHALKCDSDGDGEGDSRSRAELGGNDLLMSMPPASIFPPRFVLSATPFIHEIGHNLDLTHGGDDANNCEPNYVSVMNYDFVGGLRKVAPSVRAGSDEFSPARFPGGRAAAPLADLDEASLSEREILDPTDRLHLFTFTNALGEKVRSPVNGDVDGDGVAEGVDWDGDGAVTDASGLEINLDTSSSSTGRPEDCLNSRLTVSTGHDDWARLSLGFRQFGDLEDAAVNATTVPEPTLEEIEEQEAALNWTDLAARLAAAPEPVEAGADLTVTFGLDNHGPNPAARARVELTLGPGAAVLAQHPSCVRLSDSGVACEVGPLLAGAGGELHARLGTAGACAAGEPSAIEASATVENLSEPAGGDPVPGNGRATRTFVVVDTTAPEASCNAPASIAPPTAPLTFTATAIDFCDADPEPTIAAVACFRVNGAGVRIEERCRVSSDGPTLTIERSGGIGSVIEWTLRATDAAGNASERPCRVEVVRPGVTP